MFKVTKGQFYVQGLPIYWITSLVLNIPMIANIKKKGSRNWKMKLTL